MKYIFVLSILMTFLLQTVSCQTQKEAPMVKWKGNDDANDLVFVLKPGTTPQQNEEFLNKVIYIPRADGRGNSHPEGVIDSSFGGIGDGYVGGTLNFREDATPEQKEKLRKAIEASPIVYKVFVNAIPNKLGLPPLKKTDEDENSTPDNRPTKEIAKSQGEDEVNDLVFILKKNLPYKEKEKLIILISEMDSSPEGTRIISHRHMGRIQIYHDGGTITFTDEATKEQREKVRKIIESSSIVDKVYENVIPNKINDL